MLLCLTLFLCIHICSRQIMSAAALNNADQQILANMTNLLDTNAYDETAVSNLNGANASNAAAAKG